MNDRGAVFSRSGHLGAGPLVADDCGQGIAEYVIILAVIVVAGIVLVTAFGDQLSTVWESVTTQFGTLG